MKILFLLPLAFCVAAFLCPQTNHDLLAQDQPSKEIAATAKQVVKKFDFGDAATSEIYKHASNSDLWIYRFNPPGYEPNSNIEDHHRPSIVLFFGGGWKSGKVDQFLKQAKYLARRGMVVFLADYRVMNRQGTMPDAAVADGKSAIRWVRSNAKRLGIDPDRIAAGGGSAGGHVAATTGICDGLDDPAEQDSPVSSKPNALVLFNPVYDNGPEGYGYERIEKWFPAISPAHNVSKDDPPTIVFLGSADRLIPVATAEKFDRQLEEVGVRSELHVYDGQPHGFFNENKSKASFVDTVLKTDAFLVSLGWLQGDADKNFLNSLLKKKPKMKKPKTKKAKTKKP